MLEILLVFDSPYTLVLGGDIVPRDGAELQPGNYYVDGKSKPLHIRSFADLEQGVFRSTMSLACFEQYHLPQNLATRHS